MRMFTLKYRSDNHPPRRVGRSGHGSAVVIGMLQLAAGIIQIFWMMTH